MIEFTEDELRYIATQLLAQPYRALLDVRRHGGMYIDVCPVCFHEVRNDDDGEEVGHESKCSRQLRYALMDKLDAYYGEQE